MKPINFSFPIEIEIEVSADAHKAEAMTKHSPPVDADVEITSIRIWDGKLPVTTLDQLLKVIIRDNVDTLVQQGFEELYQDPDEPPGWEDRNDR
jgi:hypothetical protein